MAACHDTCIPALLEPCALPYPCRVSGWVASSHCRISEPERISYAPCRVSNWAAALHCRISERMPYALRRVSSWAASSRLWRRARSAASPSSAPAGRGPTRRTTSSGRSPCPGLRALSHPNFTPGEKPQLHCQREPASLNALLKMIMSSFRSKEALCSSFVSNNAYLHAAGPCGGRRQNS